MPDLPVDDVRDRISAVLDFPTSFDTPTFVEWQQQMAERIVAVLGVMYVGSECQSCGTLHRFSPPPQSCCREPNLSVPVYRFGGPRFISTAGGDDG